MEQKKKRSIVEHLLANKRKVLGITRAFSKFCPKCKKLVWTAVQRNRDPPVDRLCEKCREMGEDVFR